MDAVQTRRMRVLLDLIERRVPLNAAVQAVRDLDWDSDIELVVLTRRHVQAMLHAYEDGALSATDVTTWADGLESRDDVGFERGHEDELRQFLFEAATPEINEPITLDFARRWLRMLLA